MTLSRRITRLEESGGGKMMARTEREAAISRYVDAHSAAGAAFRSAMTPANYRQAVETSRDPRCQRVLACWLPGDDDL